MVRVRVELLPSRFNLHLKIMEELGMVNSLDTWHGISFLNLQYIIDMILCRHENVAKDMRKICAGAACARDKTWFTNNF